MKKKVLSLILTVVLSLLVSPILVRADGCIIEPGPQEDAVSFAKENSQVAFINYEDGLEKLILSVGFDDAADGTAWIFPVPSEPQEVKIDVLSDLPQLEGEDLADLAQSEWQKIGKWMLATQIYSLPVIDWREDDYYSGAMLSATSGSGKENLAVSTDVEVYEHIEKEGITTEVVTAKTATGLFDYLREKGLNVSSGSIPALDEYIGEDFTFVVSWLTESQISLSSSQRLAIVDPASLQGRPVSPSGGGHRGVFITFPTEKMYFPLLLTSVYGEEKIPIDIRVIGFVTPELFSDIEPITKVNYFQGTSLTEKNDSLKDFYESESGSPDYTRIQIEGYASNLTEDLWIDSSKPLVVRWYKFVIDNWWAALLLVLLPLSALVGLFTGLIVFREARSWRHVWKFALLGLANVVTILGVIVIIGIMKIKRGPNSKERVPDAGRKAVYVLVFSLLFIFGVTIIYPLVGLQLFFPLFF